jgi:phage-related protein
MALSRPPAGSSTDQGLCWTKTGRNYDWKMRLAGAMALAGRHAVVLRAGRWLWEVRTNLPTKRIARVLLCFYEGHLVAPHGFIKKTRARPDDDLALARKRLRELEQ